MAMTRRDILMGSGKLASGLALGVPAMNAIAQPQTVSGQAAGRKLKVLVSGGHPGDPECGCGGTIDRYTDLGHDVVLLYLNRGEGFCDEPKGADCGAVRTTEAEKACEILKAHPAFAGQYDGGPVVDNAHYDALRKQYDAVNPDVVFAQWPIDHHRDHRALSTLVLDAWLKSKQKAVLYYYEVAEDTMMFSPAQFVDITSVEPRKRAACYAHASQDPDRWYPLQEQIARFRGAESGCSQSEGFIRHWLSSGNLLP